MPAAAGQVDADKVCGATLTFLHLALCVVLPLLFSVFSWRQEWGASADGSAAGPASSPAASGWRGIAAKAANRCSSVVTAADSCLTRLLGSPARFDARAAVIAWWLLSVCWWACKYMTGLQ